MKKNLTTLSAMAENLSVDVLSSMLESAIGGLVENEICSYCKIRFDEEAKSKACDSFENCERLIFEGLLETQDRRVISGCILNSKERN